MLSLILKTISLKKVSVIWYTISSVIFGWMFVALYPSFSEGAADFEELIKAYPEEFLQAFNITSISTGTLEDFFAFEHIAILWPLLAIFLVVSLAGSLITKEIEKGTIEILLSRPISRIRLYLARYFGALLSFIFFTVLSFVVLPVFAELYDVAYRIEHYSVTAFGALLFGATILSVSFMVASFFSERNRTYIVLGGGLFIMYFANIVTNFNESLENLKYISFFHYFDAEMLMVRAEIDQLSMWVFLGVTVLSTCIGLYYFNKRDIAV
jgi:ABC-2 type transport system permease protein